MLFRKFTAALPVLILFLSLTAGPLGQQATAPAPAGRLLEIKIPAPALKDNLLGDPTELNASIYLPPGYDHAAPKRYPTVYLLHGFTSTNKVWANGYQGMNLQTTMDGLIKQGKVREMIIVAPNGWSHYGGAFYTNSSVNGNWEDYIYRDLVQYIDANYRTIATSDSRGIAGHSMGGYGALVLGMKHPDVFSAVYALSPCCTALEGDMSEANPAWRKVVQLTSKEQLKLKPQSFEEFFSIAFVALAAAFTPNPNHPPFYVDLPFKQSVSPVSASAQAAAAVEKQEPFYSSWRSQMPVYMVEENQQNLMKLHGLFIDYGQNEEFSHIVTGAQQLSKALAERHIPHTLEIYAGGDHGNKIRERMETRVLEFFSEKLAAPAVAATK